MLLYKIVTQDGDLAPRTNFICIKSERNSRALLADALKFFIHEHGIILSMRLADNEELPESQREILPGEDEHPDDYVRRLDQRSDGTWFEMPE